jgi:hypothetical protein
MVGAVTEDASAWWKMDLIWFQKVICVTSLVGETDVDGGDLLAFLSRIARGVTWSFNLLCTGGRARKTLLTQWAK